jgi:diacylglycerol kinase (ATP)
LALAAKTDGRRGAGDSSTDFENAGACEEIANRERRATLVYNPYAGGGGPDPEQLQGLLAESGFRATYRATERAEQLDEILGESTGLIVVAGGDGTFREVAKRLVTLDRPVTLLPMGTANNVARTLGIEGQPRQLIAGLRTPQVAHLDLLRARGPWGEELAVEGAGIGVYADILASYRPDAGKSLLRAVGAAASTLDADRSVRCRIEVDGERFDGDYLLLEAMNTRAIGPRLSFAPEADPTDGLLDLVLVRRDNRDAALAYFGRLVMSGLAELPSVEGVRGRSVRVNWRGSGFHVDGISLCDSRGAETKGYSAQIDVLPAALEVWLPARAVA